jgi:hypothetical protein
MIDCGKRPKGAPKPMSGACSQEAVGSTNFPLINKGLCCIAEGDGCWQGDKRNFVWDVAANNPHFFPQGAVFIAHIYFHTPLTICTAGE